MGIISIICIAVILVNIAVIGLLLGKLNKVKVEKQKLSGENMMIKQTIADTEKGKTSSVTNEEQLQAKVDEFVAERKNIELEKRKIEEKNKKIWKMSEAALKEKHRLEEVNTALQAEKEQLEAEKEKLDVKVKKLWQTSITIHKEKEKVTELLDLLAIEKKKHLEYIKAQGDVLKDIAYVQSHEVRGPLSTIMGLVQLFNYDDPADAGNIELLEGIAIVTQRLDKIVTEVVNKENSLNRGEQLATGEVA